MPVSGPITPIYLISWIFIGNFVLLNLFLAILLDSFIEEDEEEKKMEEERKKREAAAKEEPVETNAPPPGNNIEELEGEELLQQLQE